MSDRLAELSAAQRALAAQRLRSRSANASTLPAPPAPRGELGCDENAYLTLKAPGALRELSVKRVPRQPPAPGQVQFRAEAASLNFRDLMIAMGLYPATPGVPSNMGSDYAGVVTACGEGVSHVAPGDAVVALTAGDFGGDGGVTEDAHFSAYPTVSAYQIIKRPPDLDPIVAACVPTVFVTADFSLTTLGRLMPGEVVLIHAAAGGVGHAAIAIAGEIGATVVATAGSEEKRRYLRRMGIELVADSRSLSFELDVMSFTGGRGVDVVLNTLSGDAATVGLRTLAPLGRFIELDKRLIAENAPLRLGVFDKGLTYSSVDLALFLGQPELMQRLLERAVNNVAAGRWAAPPVRTWPISEAGEALAALAQTRHIGKLAVDFRS